MRSRHGAAILGLIGPDHLICSTLDGYVDAAVTLANVTAREAANQTLQLHLHRLADSGPVAALERHIVDSVSQLGAQRSAT